jgi:hypothetical protein
MSKLAYKHDWPEILTRYLTRRQNEKFQWGTMDCCLFACDAVLEMSGLDLAEDFRGKYDSLKSAARIMKEVAGGGVLEVAVIKAGVYDIEQIPVLMAQRGDVVLLSSPLGEALGIVGLDGRWTHCPGPDGVADAPLKECMKAWRIPKAG